MKKALQLRFISHSQSKHAGHRTRSAVQSVLHVYATKGISGRSRLIAGITCLAIDLVLAASIFGRGELE